MSKFSSVIFALLALTAAAASSADATAGVITIVGQPELHFTAGESALQISGLWKLRNQGNEAAAQLQPELHLGAWSWSGEARTLAPQVETEWPIAASLPLGMLDCAGDTACAGLNLPRSGLFPLFILRRYRDANGYQFSSPDVMIVPLAFQTQTSGAAAEQQALRAAFSIELRGELFFQNIEFTFQAQEC